MSRRRVLNYRLGCRRIFDHGRSRLDIQQAMKNTFVVNFPGEQTSVDRLCTNQHCEYDTIHTEIVYLLGNAQDMGQNTHLLRIAPATSKADSAPVSSLTHDLREHVRATGEDGVCARERLSNTHDPERTLRDIIG